MNSHPSEITLGDYLGFLDHIDDRKPEIVLRLEKAKTDEERETILEEPQALRDLIPYYLEEVRYFSDIPDDIISELPATTLMECHDLMVKVMRSLEAPNPVPDGRFLVEGEWYYLPTDGMKYETVQEFFEAAEWNFRAQQALNSDWHNLDKMIAVLCRKKVKGKIEPLPLDENELDLLVDARSEKFRKHLTMDVASYISFFLLTPFINLMSGLESSRAASGIVRSLMILASAADLSGQSSASPTTTAPLS